MAARRVNTTIILLVLVFLMLAATVWILYAQLRTDEVSTALSSGDVVRTLFVAHEDNQPFLAFVLFYHPATDRAAILDIPGNIGTVLQSLGRIDRIDAVFDANSPETYRREVERAIGVTVPYMMIFSEKQLVDFIDLLGGMDLFVINDYRDAAGRDPVLLPTGNVRLDGSKAVQYVRFEDEIETEIERVGKRQSFVLALLRSIKENESLLKHPDVISVRSRLVTTELDDRSQTALFGMIASIDPERTVRRRVQGTVRAVDVEGTQRYLLFPHFEGQWLKQAVQQVEQTIANVEEEVSDQISVSLEILNGTATSGLARRTSELYEDFGFEVRRFGNAESDQIEHTLVIDRRGIGENAERVAKVIDASRVVVDVQDEADIDVTLILGRDFDGSVVRSR